MHDRKEKLRKIRRKQRANRQAIYIDSCLIDACISDKKDQKQYAKMVFRKLKKTIVTNPNISVIIEFVSVGEIVNTLIKRNWTDKTEDIFQLLKNLRVDIRPPDKEILRLALRILKEDELIESTDAVIVAHALYDKNSTHLLTTDRVMIESLVIDSINKSLKKERRRKRKLKITDTF